jgi:hypothetical protein
LELEPCPLKRAAHPDINTAADSLLVSILSHCLAPPIIWQTIAVRFGDASWAQAINAGQSLSDLVHLIGRDFEIESIPSRITCLGFLCRARFTPSSLAMVRHGQAAQRDPNAPRAVNQVVRGLPPNQPEMLGYRGLDPGQGAVNRLAGVFRRGIAPVQRW